MTKLKIGIWGLGLMGGSLAKALRRRPEGLAEQELELEQLTVFNRTEQAVQLALAEGVADRGFVVNSAQDFSPAVILALKSLDVLYLGLPITHLQAYSHAITQHTEALLTDVGSVKQPVMDATRGLRFIGGHPMAGSERQGYAVGSSHLFENAPWVLCAPDEDESLQFFEDLYLLVRLAKAVGAVPLEMTAEHHDRAVAAISHLPHVVAASLVRQLALAGDPIMKRLAAGGFKDITRIASGDPELWTGITHSNKQALAECIDGLVADLKAFKQDLLSDEPAALKEFFTLGKTNRDALPEAGGALSAPALLVVDVKDQPGELAHITRILGEKNINIKNISLQDARQYEGGVLRLYLADGLQRDRAAQILAEDGYKTE